MVSSSRTRAARSTTYLAVRVLGFTMPLLLTARACAGACVQHSTAAAGVTTVASPSCGTWAPVPPSAAHAHAHLCPHTRHTPCTTNTSAAPPTPLPHSQPPGERGHSQTARSAHDAIISFFDRNKDGVIGFDEFVLIVIAMTVPEKDVEVVFDVMDLDNNGVLDSGEFLQVW